MPLAASVAWSAFSDEKQMPVEPVAEQRAQLVLGGDDGDLGAGVGERGEDRAGAQVLRVVHHHFGAGVADPRSSCRRCRARPAARR